MVVLVSDVVNHIGQIYSPLNLENMKIQKHKFVRNTAPGSKFIFLEESPWKYLQDSRSPKKTSSESYQTSSDGSSNI